jgi:O-antigen/teichoic acid export membrane protein
VTVHKVSTATLWSAADILTRQGVQFAVAVILARLLSPEEFGTIALLGLFAGIASVLVEGGMSSALVQQREVSDEDLSTVFWLNLGAGVIAACVLWLAAPQIAAFFEKPILVPLTAVMAVNVLIGACGAVQQTLFVKRLDMRPVTIASAASIVGSSVFAVVMAWQGYGVWALAGQTFVSGAVATALLWLQSSWRPSFAFSVASARRLFGFGGYMLASGLLDMSFNQLYTLIVGKLYGPAELGLYGRAQATSQTPSAVLNGIVARVAFPVFARAESEARLAADMRLALQAMMFVNAPVMLGLAAVAEPLVFVLFGPRWIPCVPVLQVLCLAGLMMPLHVLNLQALMGLGRSALFFRLEVIKKVVGIALVCSAASQGALGIAWAMVALGVAGVFINSFYAYSLFGYGLSRQIADVAPAIGAAAAATAVVHLSHSALSGQSSFMQLMLEVALGALTYGGLAFIFNLSGIKLMIDGLKRSGKAIV